MHCFAQRRFGFEASTNTAATDVRLSACGSDRREISRRRNRYIDCSQLKCRQLAKYLYRPAVIIQQPTQALPPLNPSSRVDCSLHRNDQSIVEALMISFIMIMLHEIANTAPQRVFTKEDHLLQTLFLDHSYESFRVGIQIRASRSEERRVGKECRCRWPPNYDE